MSSEYRPKFGDPIRIGQITDPVEQKEHLHRLIQQLTKEDYFDLSSESREIIYVHTEECNDCKVKLVDFANSQMFDEPND